MNQTDVPLQARKQYFVSDQTWKGLKSSQVFFQDPLEKFFFLAKLRQKRGTYGVFTCNKFSQSYASAVFAQSHVIKTVRRLKRTAGDLQALEPNLQIAKVQTK